MPTARPGNRKMESVKPDAEVGSMIGRERVDRGAVDQPEPRWVGCIGRSAEAVDRASGGARALDQARDVCLIRLVSSVTWL